MLKDLNELLMIPSVKGEPAEGAPFGVEPRRALDWFLEKASSFGLKVGNLEGYCGYAEYGEDEGEIIGVLGHLDVVPCGEGWKFEPYKLTIKDEYLYGRGVVDDKGPIIAVLYALKSIKDKGLKLKRRLRLIVGCDEESGSGCMKHYSEHGEIPVMSITPDADFPIINSEKGILRLKLTLKKDEFLKANGICISGGTTINVVPPLARLTIERGSAFYSHLKKLMDKNQLEDIKGSDLSILENEGGLEIQARGVAGHAMNPKNADNALWKLFKFLVAFDEEFPSPIVRLIHHYFCSFDIAKNLGIDDFDEESGDLTASMDIIKEEGEQMSLFFDIRYPRTSNAHTIQDTILSKMPREAVLTKESGEPPLYISKESPLVQTLLRVYNECTSLPAHVKYCGGGTYARRLPNTIAFGPTFEGAVTNIHNAGECISIEQFNLLPEIYEKAMIELTKL